MLLLLIRHAIAAEADPDKYPDDALRPLLAKGRRIQQRVSRRLSKKGLVPQRVFSSPWKRAWQTARIVLDETGLPKESRIPCPAMAEPPELKKLAQDIGPIGSDERIALVGHEPWMSELAALLLTGRADGIRMDFRKSGIMGIHAEELSAGTGELLFFWRP